MKILISIVYAILMLGFLFGSGLAIQHASRFRYLSTRTATLTLIYMSIIAILILASLGVLAWILVQK